MDCRLRDAFDALGIAPTGNISDVNRAYHRLAFSVHPDMHGSDPIYHDKFLKIKDAYDTVIGYIGSGLFHMPNGYAVMGDLDLLIAGMSISERSFRCSADIDDHCNQVNSKYVLVKGTRAVGGDWGLAVLAYDMLLHRDIVDAYIRGAGAYLSSLYVLGGGRLEIRWLLNGEGPFIRTNGKSRDYGPPQSTLAVRACIESLMHDNYPWAEHTVRYDIT